MSASSADSLAAAIPTRSNRSVALALAIAAGWLTACTSVPVTLGNNFDPAPVAAKERIAKPPPSCRMVLGAVTDERSNPGEIANLYQQKIRYKDIADWLRSAFRSLERQGIKFEAPGANATEGLPVLDVALLKAYLQPISTSKSANVVVRARVSRNGDVISERLYRGRDTGMNWLGSQSEMEVAFNLALRDLLARVAPDLKDQCAASAGG